MQGTKKCGVKYYFAAEWQSDNGIAAKIPMRMAVKWQGRVFAVNAR
jgi:hypothetical protein